jgi:Zn-dependent peptidase ImmA (M78 family)
VSDQTDANAPERHALDLLTTFGSVGFPVPVEKIAKSIGVQVRFSPLDEELSGMIFIKDGVPIVGVNSIHHPNRQRFTIAHELGHYQLHRDVLSSAVHVDKSFPVLMRDASSATGWDKREIEANQFAAALLMPKASIEHALGGKPLDIDDDRPLDDIAKRFRVSRQALEYRIRKLLY